VNNLLTTAFFLLFKSEREAERGIWNHSKDGKSNLKKGERKLKFTQET